jgi:hypothetical protein
VHNHSTARWVMTIEVGLGIHSPMNFRGVREAPYCARDWPDHWDTSEVSNCFDERATCISANSEEIRPSAYRNVFSITGICQVHTQILWCWRALPAAINNFVKPLNFADPNSIRVWKERERLVTASPVMTKSWGPSWRKKLPGERPRENAET